MTAKEQLYEKLSAEYDAFINGLKGAAPDKIIDSAYEKVFKEDILSCFEYGDSFNEKQISAMLALEYPLDSLYHNWLDTDVSHMDDLRDTIDSFIEREAGFQGEIDVEEIAKAAENTILGDSETQTAKTIYGDVRPGDWVIAAGNNDYRYLIGMVTAIDKLGTPGHETENETDDVHVDFTVFDYSNERIIEIENYFCDLYGELRAIDNLSLDDVIMAPKMLISISNLSQDEITRMGNLRQNCEAFCNCFPGSDELYDELHAALMERVEKNLSDFHNSLMGFGKRELIDMAAQIHAMSDAHNYLTEYRDYDDENELKFLLQFQNPLEIAADAWREYNKGIGDIWMTTDSIYERRASIQSTYPLMSDTRLIPDNGLYRFMNVDLVDFLGKISEKVIVHNPEDWQSQKNALYRIAESDRPEHKRLIWLVSSRGAQMYSERDMYIQNTPAFDKCVENYPNDPNLFGYVIEVTDSSGNAVTGNVFEVGDYADFANHIRLIALPLDSVTLTYSNDLSANATKTITVPRDEYDNDRDRLMNQRGRATSLRYNPSENITEISALLRSERSYRMSFAIGSQQTHLHKIGENLLEIRGQQAEKTPAEKKRSIGDRLAAGNEKVKAYKEQKAQTPENTTKHKKEDVLE